MPQVSVIVPVYNEVESLPQLFAEIEAACDSASLSFEVWLIDDGSRDGSWDVIATKHKTDARFKGVQFWRNYGKSAALAVGFERATGDSVVTMDADLQDDPAEIPALVEMLNEYDLVSGWKKKRHDPLEKRIPSKFFNKITQMVSGIKLHDFNCGLKAYRGDVVKSVKLYGELHRYVPILAKWEGYDKITEKVVNHRERQYGKTKFGFERYIRGFLDLVTLYFLTRFAARPMHFFGGFGFVLFMIGFLIELYLTFYKLYFGAGIGERPLLFLGLLLMLLGAQSFMTGLLGEMLIKPRLEGTDHYAIKTSLA